MVAQSTVPNNRESLLSLPSRPLGYVAILAAIVTAAVHLTLGQGVMEFNRTLGILFLLNGLGYLGGLGLYLSRYWRREFYLAAAGYAAITIIALFVFQGFSLDAFYTRGSLNPMAVVAKAAELLIVAIATYLYAETTP